MAIYYEQINEKIFDTLIENEVVEKLVAVKDKSVAAEILTEEAVNRIYKNGGYQTVCYDEDGSSFIETTNKNVRVGDYLVANIIDNKENCYIIGAEKFQSLYSRIEGTSSYKPKGEPRTVYRLPKEMNVRFVAPWGSEMKIRGGGVLIKEENGFYGINPEEFRATHTIQTVG